MLSYINEAFRSLERLDEDIFTTDDQGISNLATFMGEDEPENIVVFDPEASSEEDIKPSYVGKLIVTCNVCHSPVIKDKNDIEIKDNYIDNSDNPCPCCGEREGFVISGQISDYTNPSEPIESPENPVDENPEDSVGTPNEVPENKVEENYSMNTRRFIRKPSVKNEELDLRAASSQLNDLAKTLSSVLTGLKIDHKISTNDKGEIIVFHVDEQVTSEQLKKTCIQVFNNENCDPQIVNVKQGIRKPGQFAIFFGNIALTKDEVKESLNENVNNVNVETDDSIVNVSTEEDGKVTVTTEKKEPTITSEEIITPLSDEDKSNILAANNVEEDSESMSEVDFDIDDIEEESIDELGEGYLKQVYENVDSFRTSKVSATENRLIIEGVISFKSGAKKTTGFILESAAATKSGKVKFIGENKHLCRGNKAFTLTGKIENKKLIAESFTYNYKAKTGDGKSTRVYGTVHSTKK